MCGTQRYVMLSESLRKYLWPRVRLTRMADVMRTGVGGRRISERPTELPPSHQVVIWFLAYLWAPLRFYPIKRHVVVTGRPNRVGKASWLVRCNPPISRHPTPTFIFLIFLGASSIATQHSDFYKRDFVEQNGGIESYAILISSRTKSWCLSPAEGRPVASTETACVVACWCQTKARNQWSWNPSFRL